MTPLYHTTNGSEPQLLSEVVFDSLSRTERGQGWEGFLRRATAPLVGGRDVKKDYGFIVINNTESKRDQAHQGSSVDASKEYTLHVFDIKEKSDGNDQESDGCVQLERHERGKANLAWSKAAETSSAASDPSDVEFTPTTISEGVGASEAPLEWGIQLTGISPRIRGLKEHLDIDRFPIAVNKRSDTASRLLDRLTTEEIVPGLTSTFIDILTAGSILPFQQSLVFMTAVYYLHRGAAPFQITVIPPVSQTLFEEFIKTKYPFELQDSDELCSQFVHHLALWLPHKVLQKHKIPFIEVTLQPEQCIVLFKNAYYCARSTGYAVLEHWNSPVCPLGWDYTSYRFCQQDNELCANAEKELGIEIFEFPDQVVATNNLSPVEQARKKKVMTNVMERDPNFVYQTRAERDRQAKNKAMTAAPEDEEPRYAGFQYSDLQGSASLEAQPEPPLSLLERVLAQNAASDPAGGTTETENDDPYAVMMKLAQDCASPEDTVPSEDEALPEPQGRLRSQSRSRDQTRLQSQSRAGHRAQPDHQAQSEDDSFEAWLAKRKVLHNKLGAFIQEFKDRFPEQGNH